MKKRAISIQIIHEHIILHRYGNVKGKGSVISSYNRSIEGKSNEEIADELRQMVGLLPKKPERAYLVIPRHFVTLRQMWLPSEDCEEIESMIGIKLLKDIPSSVEDVTYQYVLLDKNDQGFHRILVIIIRKDLVQKYHWILQKAGIRNPQMTISSFGVLGWSIDQQRMRRDTGAGGIALIDLDDQHAEICFCSEHKLFFSKSISPKIDLRELIQRIVLTQRAYQGEALGPEVQEVFVISERKDSKALAAHLQEELGICVRTLNPWGHINGALFEKGSSNGVAALGVLLGPIEKSINLAFEQEDNINRKETRKRQLVKFSVLAVTILLLTVSGPLIEMHKKRAYLTSLNKEVRISLDRLSGLTHKKKIVDFFEQRPRDYFLIPELMTELGKLTPEDMTFRTIALDRERRLTIQGYVENRSGINDFHAQLIRSAFFCEVKMEFASERMIAHKPVVDFRIVLQLDPEGMAQL